MNPRRRSLFLLGTLLVAIAALPAPLAGASSKRPNLIFLLADDMGYGDLSGFGNTGLRTPQLDRMLAEGVRIDSLYVAAPICSPSRTAFITGQYPQRWRITSFLSNRAANERRGMANFLDPDAPTLARCLQAAGYATGHFGKWHLGGQRDVGEAPPIAAYGFDRSLTQFEGLGERLAPVFSRPMEPGWKDGRHPLGVASEKLGHGQTTYAPRAEVTGRWIDRTLKFIGEARAAGKPFYVNVWSDDPHTPVEPSEPLRGDGSLRTRYAGVVRELDRDLGRLIEHVRQDPELRDNTLIIFASDNGPEEGCGSTGGLRGNKGELYEGGIREPFIVWGPGLIAQGAVGRTDRTSTVSAMDLAPTLLAIAGVPAIAGYRFDGLAQAEVFLGRGQRERVGPLFWSRPPDRPGAKKELPDLAVREDGWKLLCESDGSSPQLYDLSADPGEMIDLALSEPLRTADLVRKALAWQAGMPR